MPQIYSLNILQDILLQFWPVFPAVFAAGAIDAIAGGGGLITLPVYMLAGLPPHQAIGTNKLSSCMGTTLAAGRFAIEGYIKWKLAAFAVPLALAGSFLGAQISLLIDNRLFKVLMLFILPAAAVFVLRNKQFDTEREPYDFCRTCILSGLTAFTVGIYDGFYGPGTGTFLILLLTAAAHMTLKEANGLTKAINLTTNVTSLAVFLINGTVLIPLGLLAGLCNMAGNWIGVSFFDKKGGAVVRPVILLVLTVFLVKTILELIGG